MIFNGVDSRETWRSGYPMNEQEFDAVAAQITNIFWQRSEDAAVAERDRINEELSRQNQRIAFQGPPGGNYLAYFLFDTTTKQEIPCVSRRNGLSSPGILCL